MKTDKIRDEGARLHRAIAERKTPRHRLSRELREQATAYAKKRKSQSASVAMIARELGLAQPSVLRWLGTESPSKAMIPVRVVEARTRPGERITALVVTTPRGLRIEGLDVDALCTFVERCG